MPEMTPEDDARDPYLMCRAALAKAEGEDNA